MDEAFSTASRLGSAKTCKDEIDYFVYLYRTKKVVL